MKFPMTVPGWIIDHLQRQGIPPMVSQFHVLGFMQQARALKRGESCDLPYVTPTNKKGLIEITYDAD